MNDMTKKKGGLQNSRIEWLLTLRKDFQKPGGCTERSSDVQSPEFSLVRNKNQRTKIASFLEYFFKPIIQWDSLKVANTVLHQPFAIACVCGVCETHMGKLGGT